MERWQDGLQSGLAIRAAQTDQFLGRRGLNPNNCAARVAEKAGAQPEGELRNRVIVRDNILNGIMFSLTPPAFDFDRGGKPSKNLSPQLQRSGYSC